MVSVGIYLFVYVWRNFIFFFFFAWLPFWQHLLKNRSVSKEITMFVDRMNITKSSVISASVCVEVIPACICMPS